MRRRPLYSSTPTAQAPAGAAASAVPGSSSSVHSSAAADTTALKPARASALRRSGQWLKNRQMALVVAALALLCAALSWQVWQRSPRVLTQKDIDAAVLSTLQTNVMPSQAAAAYENVRPSIVRVVSFVKKSRLEDMKAAKLAKQGGQPGKEMKKSLPPGKSVKPKDDDPLAMKQKEKDKERDRMAPDVKMEEDEVEFGVGTGVVIVDKGVILTNWHVVQGADRIKITFMDGLEAEADIKGVQAEDDLAVLQARKIPDDLIAATMRSTADLAVGDHVIAVGFPFGIGPSTSAGIVSGLKRSFRSPDGGQTMKNLIQFDAAANPGNSGGPLVTMDGEVVGIVTAIMNPTPARTFIGIGFAVPIENAASAAGMPPF
jgi:serine protease DegQ